MVGGFYQGLKSKAFIFRSRAAVRSFNLQPNNIIYCCKIYFTAAIENFFYEKTGMYIDFDQVVHLPEISTLVDIGVGDIGTTDFYERFPDSRLILIDLLVEAQNYAKKILVIVNTNFLLQPLVEKRHP